MEAVLKKKQYDVFLCHSTSDIANVEQVASQLAAAGLNPFLDKWHLVPGEPWQENLERALDDSKCCAVFLGPTGLGPWENEELRVALDARVRDEQYRVIPVLLPNAQSESQPKLPSFLRRLTWVDLRSGISSIENAQGLHRLIAGIRGEQPGRVELDHASTTELAVKITDYYKPDLIALTRNIFALADEFVVPPGATVRFLNPDYAKLKECIRRQNQTVNDVKIVTQQLGALHKSDVMIARTEKQCAVLLHEMSRNRGINVAIECCRWFIELRLCKIVIILGHYQLSKGAIFHGFDGLDWNHEEEMLIEFVFGENTFVDVKLAETGPHYSDKEYATVYLPLQRIENDGSGGLIANLWEEAEHIPLDVWETYVIPQCAVRSAAGQLKTMIWNREGISYVTEGEVWRKGRRIEYTRTRLGDVTFLIPKASLVNT